MCERERKERERETHRAVRRGREKGERERNTQSWWEREREGEGERNTKFTGIGSCTQCVRQDQSIGRAFPCLGEEGKINNPGEQEEEMGMLRFGN